MTDMVTLTFHMPYPADRADVLKTRDMIVFSANAAEYDLLIRSFDALIARLDEHPDQDAQQTGAELRTIFERHIFTSPLGIRQGALQ